MSRAILAKPYHLHTIKSFLAITPLPQRFSSAESKSQNQSAPKDRDVMRPNTSLEGDENKPKKKTTAQLDEELGQKMREMAGDGGEAGVEYEDGKPVAMKRSVKDNMFRYI